MKKNISSIAQISWWFLTLKNVVTWMPETFRFITSFRNQRVHGSQTLVNSSWPHFYPNFRLIQDKSQVQNISLSQFWDLGLFGNTLTADHMNSPYNRVKLPQQFQTSLSPKPKLFSQAFFCICKIYIKFCEFWKKRSAS